jgi:hypothetical protein
MIRQAVVEIWPAETVLFVPDLPGFQVNAANPDVALREATERIERFLQWLQESELAEEVAPSTGIDIAEHREFALAIGRAALSDLLFVLDDLDPDHYAAATRTLRHVAEMDRWYATRLAPADGQPFAEIEDEVVQSASLFEETIDGLLVEAQSRCRTVDGEQWTIRKALRRRTGHLREHLFDLLAFSQ